MTVEAKSVTNEELRQSEERLRLMIGAVKDYAIFLLDPEGRVASWNEGAQRIKGYSADEIIGQHFSIFYPEDALARKWPEYELEVASREGRFEDEGWRVRKDGSRFWANVVITALIDEDGTLVGFTKVTRDLTERKRQEEELRRSEERHRLMVEEVKDYAIFLLDPEGRVASWNEGAQRIKGYSADEIIGQHFSIFYPEDALARKWPEYELEVASREGRFEDEGWRVRKDGSRFWANVVITALFDEDGTLVGFTKVTRDLTERRLHEKALEKSQKQLKVAYRELEQKNRALERANLDLAQRNAELQDFAYAASHDLQEPLRKISTFSELLEVECGAEIGEEGRMFIDRIRQSVRRMSMLISGLLSYSHVATRTQPFQKIDLNQIIEGVLDDLQLLLEETGGRVDVDSLPSIEADPIQMRRLFQNFIENALKFRRSGVPAVIRITPGEPAAIRDVGGRQMCTIDVTDNGIGFEEKYLDRIFVPFQRLHTLRVYEGAGLGLAICKRVVERHEGTITARSTPGRGTTFTISLPVNHVPEVTAF